MLVCVTVGVTVGVGVGVGVNGIIHPTINDHVVSGSLLSIGLTITLTFSDDPSTLNLYGVKLYPGGYVDV